MHIGSQTDFVNILAVEGAPAGSQNVGHVRIAVQVSLGEFGGSYASVWLEEAVLREFVEQLARLEYDRTGSARLTSCSPDEFILTIRSRDKLGHLAGEVSLSRYRHSAGEIWPTRVAGGFDIDPGSLAGLLADFRGLLGS